jgi:hypothetical protein
MCKSRWMPRYLKVSMLWLTKIAVGTNKGLNLVPFFMFSTIYLINKDKPLNRLKIAQKIIENKFGWY